ncbi:MAG: hypothetical protein HZA46_07555 [Planctomycetales bacterium]|nr:hypothetical protein [Planctomycetales bacterium]
MPASSQAPKGRRIRQTLVHRGVEQVAAKPPDVWQMPSSPIAVPSTHSQLALKLHFDGSAKPRLVSVEFQHHSLEKPVALTDVRPSDWTPVVKALSLLFVRYRWASAVNSRFAIPVDGDLVGGRSHPAASLCEGLRKQSSWHQRLFGRFKEGNSLQFVVSVKRSRSPKEPPFRASVQHTQLPAVAISVFRGETPIQDDVHKLTDLLNLLWTQCNQRHADQIPQQHEDSGRPIADSVDTTFHIDTMANNELESAETWVLTPDFYWDLVHGTPRDHPQNVGISNITNYGEEVVIPSLRTGARYQYFFPNETLKKQLAHDTYIRLKNFARLPEQIRFYAVPRAFFQQFGNGKNEYVIVNPDSDKAEAFLIDFHNNRKAGGRKCFNLKLEPEETSELILLCRRLMDEISPLHVAGRKS